MLTRDDARTVRALASLARFAPQQMRAAHLIGKAEQLAARIEREAELAEEGLEAFASPVATTPSQD